MPVAHAHSPLTRACRPASDWPVFGHDLNHSFATSTSCISRHNATTLRPKWFYNSGSPITAQPVVSDGIVYAGSYDGRFHAVRAKNGKSAWTKSFNVHRYDNNIVDFGGVPGAASVNVIAGRRVVFFGSGGTLFALDAKTGALVDKVCLDRVDPTCQGKAGYTTEIESSPSVIVTPDGSRAQVLIGTDVNEASPAGPAGLVSLQFDGAHFAPHWWFDPEIGVTWPGLAPLMDVKKLTENGCNDVWASPTVDLSANVVVIGLGNCNHPERVKRAPGVTKPTLVESTVGIDLATGQFRWEYTPRPAKNGRDLDFGATPNLLAPGVIGEAGKDGTYYAYNSHDGALLWKVKVAEASEIGGIIASTAVGRFSDGHQAIFAASAIPVSAGGFGGSVQDIRRHPLRALGLHAIDATTHKVRWHAVASANYGAPTFASHLVFLPNTFSDTFQIFDADHGVLLRAQPMNNFPASPPAIAGDSVYLGTGITEAIPIVEQLARLGGLWAFTTTT
jgi:outer membrane protein assembly factor BamB